MEQLYTELKTLIIDSLNLEDISVEDIGTNEPLFNDGLGLDSIDALELGLAIKMHYNIEIDTDTRGTRQHFSSVSALASYIAANQTT